MPDIYEDSLNKINTWLETQKISHEKLFADNNIQEGWSFLQTWKGKTISLIFKIDTGFPFSKIRVSIAPPLLFLSFPHVEIDGAICLFHSEEYHNHHDALEFFLETGRRATELLKRYEQDPNIFKEFQDEYKTYWDFFLGGKKPENWFVIEDLKKLRNPLYSISTDRGIYLSSDVEALDKWTKNINTPISAIRNNAILIQLSEIISPPYPRTVKDLINILSREQNCLALTRALKYALFKDESLIVLLCNNSALFALKFKHPNPGSINKKKFKKPIRKLIDAPLSPHSINRADKAWVFGRDKNKDLDTLGTKTAVIIGCGSVGSLIAKDLVQSGIGKLILVDYGTLEWSNISRHELGSFYVGKPKALALKFDLDTRFPHISIEAIWGTWEKAINQTPDIFKNVDIIISATANFNSEAKLNLLKRQGNFSAPILYAWTTPHSISGHIISIVNDKSCFECWVSAENKLNIEPVIPPLEGFQHREPSCGGLFSPYGIVELSYITSLAAQTAIDILLGRVKENTHSIWIASKKFIDSLGLQISPEWEEKYGKVDSGKIIEVPWAKNSECKSCQNQ